MVKEIDIKKYKKFADKTIKFEKSLNAISGTNGTGKSSLLYIISNAYKRVNKRCAWIKDENCLSIINSINSEVNPKVESLTRERMDYLDPAQGIKGNLFKVKYYDHNELEFRRHNSPKNSRYAIKPIYKNNSHDKLPQCPIIYLGLSRLIPYGEYDSEKNPVSSVRNRLPEKYQTELNDLYNEFTHYKINSINVQKLGDIKTRTQFKSDIKGVDSNTISAGEDNLYIILTALVSLHYYFDSIDSKKTIESILLIDELDATLHPSFQIKLLEKMREYAHEYKIQIVFTTHSLSALENSLLNKDNVIYLINQVTNVDVMSDPDIYKIKMHLNTLTTNDIYQDKVIPVFTEDEEARFLLDRLFEYFQNQEEFKNFIEVKRFFHLVKANLGANSLRDIFKDNKLLKNTMKAICILDGDQNVDKDKIYGIIALPGKNHFKGETGKSPEKLLFDYAEELFNKDNNFWSNNTISSRGYSKEWYLDKIKVPIDKFEKEEKNGKNKEKKRQFNKKLFNDQRDFFDLLFKNWLNNSEHESMIRKFYYDLREMFKKVAPYNGIDKNLWQ